MTLTAKRWVALALAVMAAVVGTWAAAFPLSFYHDFPGPGRNWVSALGPYNEHLTRDTGALYLAMLVLSVWAWRRPTDDAMRVTGGAWLMFNAIHFLWHMLHLEVFPTIDKIGNAAGLGGALVLSILLLLPVRAATAQGLTGSRAKTGRTG
ncbi:hypothetical protein [Paractinoplanes maris]|uniref:hypothetical protein n=1 Tax=Paractinoplanes maris TaxID=1734446 RepID=UPI002020FAD1|nr:hypothetical protein [Actinoplanes maris]